MSKELDGLRRAAEDAMLAYLAAGGEDVPCVRERLGASLARMRRYMGMTQKDMAHAVGLSKQMGWDAERGRGSMKAIRLCAEGAGMSLRDVALNALDAHYLPDGVTR